MADVCEVTDVVTLDTPDEEDEVKESEYLTVVTAADTVLFLDVVTVMFEMVLAWGVDAVAVCSEGLSHVSVN